MSETPKSNAIVVKQFTQFTEKETMNNDPEISSTKNNNFMFNPTLADLYAIKDPTELASSSDN